MTRSDSALLAIASTGPVESYVDASARLCAIEAELDTHDGLIWFNRLYASMTLAVIENARKHRFDEPLFVERLGCHLADLYFVALTAHLSDPGSGPSAWGPLFHSRTREGTLPVQYALAGVNAHINRDMPVALVSTFLELDRAPDRNGPVHTDYLSLNSIMEGALNDAKPWLLRGVLDELDATLSQADEVLEMWSSRRARDAAWISSEVRWALRVSPLLSRHHLEALDRMVGLVGRGLLRPAHPSASQDHRSSSPPSR
jgi:hypothetical protein